MQRVQGSEEAPEQDTDAGEDDVLLEWNDDALLREGRGGHPPARAKVQPPERDYRRLAEHPLPEADQQQPRQLGNQVVRSLPVLRAGHFLLIIIICSHSFSV